MVRERPPGGNTIGPLAKRRRSVQVHTGALRPEVRSQQPSLSTYTSKLNLGQRAAFLRIVNTNRNSLVVGPPGTGKTFLILQLIRYYLDNNFCVIVCAPLARVLKMMRDLPKHRAYRVQTLHGFVRENTHFKRSKPGPKFMRLVNSCASVVCPRASTGAAAPLVGILSECFAAPGPMIDYWVMCLKALRTCTLAKLVFEGDPTQCEAIGEPTNTSRCFDAGQLEIVAVTESMRFSGLLADIVADLRDYRRSVTPRTLIELDALSRRTMHRGPAETELCPTHATCVAGRRRCLKDYEYWMCLRPTGRERDRPRNRYIAYEAEVMITRNLVLGRDDCWRPDTVDAEAPGEMQDRKRFVANGDLATVVDYPLRTRSGKGRPFSTVRAGDDLVPFITLQLDDGTRIDVAPTKSNGVTTFEVDLARFLTIHSQQGRTLTSGSINLCEAYNPRVLAMVALSRFRRIDQIHRLVCDDPTALGNGGPTSSAHRKMVVMALKAEEEAAMQFGPGVSISVAAPTPQHNGRKSASAEPAEPAAASRAGTTDAESGVPGRHELCGPGPAPVRDAGPSSEA